MIAGGEDHGTSATSGGFDGAAALQRDGGSDVVVITAGFPRKPGNEPGRFAEGEL